MGNEQKPASVPLATPGGEVRGWVCGVCARVGAIHGTLAPPDAEERARMAESSRKDADDCCVCRGCGAVGTDVWPRECPACREKREAKWAAEQPERDAKAAEDERIREEALAVCLDRDAAGALAAKMSDISEDCYCAGWLSGLEHSLWWFVVGGPGEWGMGKVDEDDVRALRALSEKCGGWIVWREGVGEVFVPLAEWLPAYAAEQERVKAWNAAPRGEPGGAEGRGRRRMNTDYSDIRSRIPEPPIWFDEHAVPRYCPFVPSEAADIYAKEVVLLLVECQACEHEFKVCLSWSAMDGVRGVPPLSANPAGLEYHDPPNVECCAAGPTMNSVPIRVLEFWRKERGDWERVPAFEVEIACEWAER